MRQKVKNSVGGKRKMIDHNVNTESPVTTLLKEDLNIPEIRRCVLVLSKKVDMLIANASKEEEKQEALSRSYYSFLEGLATIYKKD